MRGTIELDWGPVSFLDWRPECEPRSTVLLLHGGGVDGAELSWGEVGPKLAAAGHRVIAPDTPGFGESPRPPWRATQERLVAYVGEVVDELGLERYAVGGLSLGGGMTIGHVLDRPDGVTGAILMGSYGIMDHMVEGPLGRPTTLVTWAMLRTGALHAIQRVYGRNRRLMDRSLRPIVRNPAQLTPELLDAVWDAAQRAGTFEVFEQWQRDQLRWNRARTNYASRLDRFPVPALIVHGERDTGVPVARARAAAQRIPDATLVVIPGAGHWVQRDRPDLVIPAVVDFLDRIRPDAPPAHP